MSWEIVVGLITLCTFLISFGTILVKLTSSITKLDLTMKQFWIFKDSAEEEHKEIHETLNNHETRITVLEHHENP